MPPNVLVKWCAYRIISTSTHQVPMCFLMDRRPFDECAQKYIHRVCKQVTQTNALERISVTLIPHAKYVYTDMHVVHVCSLITLAHASFLYTHTIKYSQSIRRQLTIMPVCLCTRVCVWWKRCAVFRSHSLWNEFRNGHTIKLVQTARWHTVTNECVCVRESKAEHKIDKRHTHSHRRRRRRCRRMVREKEGRPAIEKAQAIERQLHCTPAEAATSECGKETITCGCCANGCFTVGSSSSYDSFRTEFDATAAVDSADRSFTHIGISHSAMRSHIHTNPYPHAHTHIQHYSISQHHNRRWSEHFTLGRLCYTCAQSDKCATILIAPFYEFLLARSLTCVHTQSVQVCGFASGTYL